MYSIQYHGNIVMIVYNYDCDHLINPALRKKEEETKEIEEKMRQAEEEAKRVEEERKRAEEERKKFEAEKAENEAAVRIPVLYTNIHIPYSQNFWDEYFLPISVKKNSFS